MPQPMRFAFVHTACTHSKQRALNVQAILLSSTTERVLFLLRFNSATSFLARLAVGCVHFSRWACVLFFVFHYGNFCFLPINCTSIWQYRHTLVLLQTAVLIFSLGLMHVYFRNTGVLGVLGISLYNTPSTRYGLYIVLYVI